MNSDQFQQRLKELESFYEAKLNELKSFYDESLNESKANSEIQIKMNEKQYQVFYSLVIDLLKIPRFAYYHAAKLSFKSFRPSAGNYCS